MPDFSESPFSVIGDCLLFRRHNRSLRSWPDAGFLGRVLGFGFRPSGARVANATVTLTNPEKGITRTFKTNDEGNFSFALLPAGTYTLTVEAAGFKTFKVASHHAGSRPICEPGRHLDDRGGVNKSK